MDITEDGFLSLMDNDNGTTRDNLKLPENELGEQIQESLEKGTEGDVTVLSAMNEEQVVDFKAAKNEA